MADEKKQKKQPEPESKPQIEPLSDEALEEVAGGDSSDSCCSCTACSDAPPSLT